MRAKALTLFAVAAGTLLAANRGPADLPQGDQAVAQQIRHEILMYPYFSIWDDVSFRVSNGQVQLEGAVTQPWKRADLARLVRRVPGVSNLTDQVRVLPLSNFDDGLRLQIARAIYGDPLFVQYRNLALPPIHIVVDNGRVTLTGVVATDMEKQIAGLRANSSLSFGAVVNHLVVEHPAAPRKS